MKYYLLDKETNSHLSVKVTEDALTLFHSRKGEWADKCSGKQAVKVTYDGDYYHVKVGSIFFTLDISDLGNLRVALQELNRNKPNWFSRYVSTRAK